MSRSADPAPPSDRPRRTIGVVRTARVLMRIKLALLRGALRGPVAQKLQVLGAVAASVVLGLSLAALIVGIGSSVAHADALLVTAATASTLAMALLSSATGVESTIDARLLAGEPLRPVELTIGLLAAAVVGPAALLSALIGVAVAATWWVGGVVPALLVLAGVLGWMVTVLLVSRTCANVLGAVATGRFRQLAQAGATLAALVSWLLAQLLLDDIGGWGADRWTSIADAMAWTPPGQLALAVTEASRPAEAALHLLLGLAWLPLLVMANIRSTMRLALSSPRPGGDGRRRRSRLASSSFLRTVTPPGQVGALARRTLLTRARSPRQAVNTVTALAVGGGALLIAPLLGDQVDARLVLIAGMLHFAVLFDGNNAFGYDGPATWMEVSAGADATALVRGKALAALVVMAPAAVALPVVVAAMTGGWHWLPAAWLVAAGSLAGAAGIAVANAALAPVAMPDSPNPLAVGDTGQGCIAAVMITVCIVALTLMSLPAAVLIFLASERSAPLTSLAALSAVLIGAAVLWGGTTLAAGWLRGREAELVQRVTLGR